MKEKNLILGIAFLSVSIVYFFSQNFQTHNGGSRLAAIDSLVHRHTFVIDESPLRETVDRVWLNGHFYSSKPPILSLAAAPFYWGYASLLKKDFQNDESRAIRFVSLLVGLSSHVVLMFFFYLLLISWVQDRRVVAVVFASLSLGYVGVSYATGVNNHTVAAAITMVGLYCLSFIVRSEKAHPLYWIVCGFTSGLLPVVDQLPSFVFSFAVFLLLWRRDKERTLFFFLPAFCIPVIQHLFIMYVLSQSFFPFPLRWKELYFYPGSYWLKPLSKDALNEPKWVYFFNLTFGHHGLFSVTPLLALGAWEIYRQVKMKKNLYFEARVIGTSFFFLFFFYLFSTKNYGGDCLGMRWLIHLMPPVFLFSAVWLENEFNKKKFSLYLGFFLIGALNVASAIKNPWIITPWEKMISKIF